MAILPRFLIGRGDRFIARQRPTVQKINALEDEISKLTDGELIERSQSLRNRHRSEGVSLDDLLPEAFALVREAAKRTLHQRHYDVQLVGGIVLHQAKIAEMRTGEGKTLVATLPSYLNSLTGKGVHIVTVNDYLARRDAAWMGQVYHALGVTVGCITQESAYQFDPDFVPEQPDETTETTQAFRVHEKYLKPVSRREAYALDIVYATNNTIGFDYLRDNLVYDKSQLVQRPFYYAIIDEVDSILIDESRTPLIISSPDSQSSQMYRMFARVIPKLKKDDDYTVDEKMRTVVLTEKGIAHVESLLGVKNLYTEGDIEKIFHLEQALKAFALFQRDHQYVVRDNQVVIVDEFTGRLMPDRRFSEGIHQALEAKEGVPVKEESKTLATITFQNLFRKYPKLSGMTGTAKTSEEEFFKVYGLEVVVVPTHKPMIRKDQPDSIYRSEKGKIQAIVREVAARHQKGQPVLIGTVSIEKNEVISKALQKAHVPHEVLNAKNHEREGTIIAQAGRRGAVTVATNMAGRGVDIMLGGNPPEPATAKEVRELGGLYVLGTERHEARRIDNQIRGRSGRQGDPGESRFFVSMEDDLMRVFGSDRAKNMMKRLGVPEDQPIEHGLISKGLEKAQEKIEGFHFDTRKYVLEYDQVLNKQREAIYRMRREALFSDEAADSGEKGVDEERLSLRERVMRMAGETAGDIIASTTMAERARDWDAKEIVTAWKAFLPPDFSEFTEGALKDIISRHERDLEAAREALAAYLTEVFEKAYKAREKLLGQEVMRQIEKVVILSSIDTLWTSHLDTMERLRESVRLRAYGQQDPLVEYRREGARLFEELKSLIANQVLSTVLKLAPVSTETQPAPRLGVALKPAQPNPISVTGGTPEPLNPAQMPSARPTPLQGNVTALNDEGRYQNVGRNDPCPCGSGKKFKKCHGR